MARDDAPRKMKEQADKPEKPEYNDKWAGPKIPGAEARPIVGKAKKIQRKPRPKSPKPTDDPVEKSERYMKKMEGTGGISAHAEKMLRISELKRLIQPLTPSLIQVMSDIAHDKKVHPAIRLDAADRLFNRLYGKPTERVEMTDPGEEEINDDEVKLLLNRILENVGAPTLEFHDDEHREKPPKGDGS